MELPELLDENIFDILSRLPVKSLMRFKCVSKPWCSLISDPQFIKAHFSRLDQMSSKMLVTTQREAWILDDEDSENSMVELNYPIAVQTSKLVICVGSCNGLVCLLLDSYTFILWNPSTGEFRQVPPLIPSSYDIYDTHDFFSVDFYGFGYDSSIDDYKRLYHVRNQLFWLPFSYQLHFTRNYKLVLGFHRRCGIRMYDLEAMTSKDFEKDGSSFSDGTIYIESLVSPN